MSVCMIICAGLVAPWPTAALICTPEDAIDDLPASTRLAEPEPSVLELRRAVGNGEEESLTAELFLCGFDRVRWLGVRGGNE